MLRNIITIATMIALAIHAVLGCCAHHSHACGTSAFAEVKTGQSNDHGCCHHHDQQTQPESGDHRHSHGNDGGSCNEDHCNFINSGRDFNVELMLKNSIWHYVTGIDSALTSIEGPICFVRENPPPSGANAMMASQAVIEVWLL